MAVVAWRFVSLLGFILISIVSGLPNGFSQVTQSPSNRSVPRSENEFLAMNETYHGDQRFPLISSPSAPVHNPINIKPGIKMRKKIVKGYPEFYANRGTPRIPDHLTTVITVINATPYRWRRGYIHSYQIDDWDSDWPKYIESGQSFQMTSFRLNNGFSVDDSAAEVVYHLEDTWTPASFMLERRRGRRHHIYVKFLENLQTRNLKRGGEINLDYHPYPGGSQFLLAGWEGEFITLDPPKGWMQDSLSDIGSYTLNEIVLPRSHHAGMSTSRGVFGVARPINTFTQTKTVSEQIEKFGIRVLDLRPVRHKGNFYASHGSMVLGSWNGMLGESVKDIAKAIGEFHRKYPGEIIIVDIPSAESGKVKYGWQGLNVHEIWELYYLFIDYAKTLSLPMDADIKTLPLRRLMSSYSTQEGKSPLGGTIVRVDRSWAINRILPGPDKGFISSEDLPLNHRWSDMNTAEKVAADQIKALTRNRPRRNSKMFFSDWIATQTTTEAVLPVDSITKMALPMYNALYNELWNVTTDNMYPNWIAMDHIHSRALVAFVRTLNRCMVARRCGTLGGKVPVPVKPLVMGESQREFEMEMDRRKKEDEEKEREEVEKKELEKLEIERQERQRLDQLQREKEKKEQEEEERELREDKEREEREKLEKKRLRKLVEEMKKKIEKIEKKGGAKTAEGKEEKELGEEEKERLRKEEEEKQKLEKSVGDMEKIIEGIEKKDKAQIIKDRERKENEKKKKQEVEKEKKRLEKKVKEMMSKIQEMEKDEAQTKKKEEQDQKEKQRLEEEKKERERLEKGVNQMMARIEELEKAQRAKDNANPQGNT